MSEVFISYSRKDNEFVDKLIMDLERNGVHVWIDRHDIEGGTAWRAAIAEAVRQCSAFVIVLSPNSTSSRNVSRELSVAESHDRLIVPVIYRACDIPPGMEYQLAELQWINLTAMTYEEGLRRLVKVLNKGAETDGETPAQNVEKRRSDTARLRKILEGGAAHSPDSQPNAASRIDSSTPGGATGAATVLTASEASAPLPPMTISKVLAYSVAPTSRKMLYLFVVAALLVMIGAWIVYRFTRNDQAERRMLTTEPFEQNFANWDNWEKPQNTQGWTPMSDPISLNIKNEVRLGYTPDLYFHNFEESFYLTLGNSASATWAVRVQNSENYYFFRIERIGNECLLTFNITKNGAPVESGRNRSPISIAPNGHYTIRTNVEGYQFKVFLIDEGGQSTPEGEKPIGTFYDNDKTFCAGGIGFRAGDPNEEFTISPALKVVPMPSGGQIQPCLPGEG